LEQSCTIVACNTFLLFINEYYKFRLKENEWQIATFVEKPYQYWISWWQTKLQDRYKLLFFELNKQLQGWHICHVHPLLRNASRIVHLLRQKIIYGLCPLHV